MTTYREMRLKRKDRPFEMWRGDVEELESGEVVVRCGVCLQGRVKPKVGEECGLCGAVVDYVYFSPGSGPFEASRP